MWAAQEFGRRDVSIATLAEVKNARWESSSLPTEAGAKLGKGRLRLVDGIARIVFRRGAEVSLEGPAELELIDSNSCFLHSGALIAHVPELARGFSVGTTHARLIDHGTDFASTVAGMPATTGSSAGPTSRRISRPRPATRRRSGSRRGQG